MTLRTLAALLACFPLLASASVFEATFSSGQIPAGMATERLSPAAPGKSFYKKGYTDAGWTVELIGRSGYAAIAPTRSSDGTVESRLKLPEITVGEGDRLRWRALSVYPDFPDSYRVEIRESGGEWTPLTVVEDEAGDWTDRSVSLGSYVGKAVEIAFTTTSVDGYMLAVDDINVGPSTASDIIIRDLTPVSYGIGDSDCGTVTVEIQNLGSAVEDYAVKVTSSGFEETKTVSLESFSTTSVSFSLPSELNTKTSYKINETVSGDFYVSNFRRVVVVDEGTGMWCNNCPQGIVALEEARRNTRGEIIALTTHTGNDVLANTGYWQSLRFYAVPYFMVNRVRSTSSSNLKDVPQYFAQPTDVELSLDWACRADDGEFVLSVSKQSVGDVSCKVGLAFTKEFFDPSENSMYYQSNIVTTAGYRQYYFLPSTIPSELVRFHDVTVSSYGAFDGADPGVIRIPAGEFPSEVEGSSLVLYLLDSRGQILNATVRILDEAFLAASAEIYAGIETVENGASSATLGADGLLSVKAEGDWRVELFAPTGVCALSLSGYGNYVSQTDLGKGMYILRLSVANEVISSKSIIK